MNIITLDNKKRLEHRILLAKRNPEPQFSNCAGTAFYLLGVLNVEIEIDDNNEVEEIIKTNFQSIPEPKDYCLVTYESDSGILHVGVAVYNESENRFNLIHRRGPGGELRDETDLFVYNREGEVIDLLKEIFEQNITVGYYELKTN